METEPSSDVNVDGGEAMGLVEPEGCFPFPKHKRRTNSGSYGEKQRIIEKDGTSQTTVASPQVASASGDGHQLEVTSAMAKIPKGYSSGSDHCYDMGHRRRGKMTIISNRNFLPGSPMHSKPRNGAEYDAANLESTFTFLGFECKICEDKTCAEMLQIFKDASKDTDTDCDCMAFALLSHGEDHGMIHGTDGLTSIDNLLGPLKDPTRMKGYAGKPKLIFVQACRGGKLDEGMDARDDPSGYVQIRRIPVEADFLYTYASAPGYVSFRGKYGSVFIRALCEMLSDHHASLDLLSILTRVNYEVAYFFESRVSKEVKDHEILSYKKQMPTIVSMLTKDFYFVPKQLALEKRESSN